MLEQKLSELTEELKNSEEFTKYLAARERAEENDSTATLLREYHRAQMRVQALVMQNITEGPDFDRFRSLSDALQTDADAASFLLAEYRLKKVLGDVFKTLTHAVDLDLGFLE